VYSPQDLAEFDYDRELGFPGQFPFTRGVQPTMYRGRFWTMRQYAGFGTAEESNARYRYLLGQGQTGLSVAFDLPTQTGYDPDAALSEGEVGKVGVSIASLEDMEVLFDQIPLDKVSTSMTINATANVLLALYIAIGKRQGVPVDKLDGTVQNDILKEYVARGTYIYPPRPSMRLIVDTFKYCSANVPRWNTISISGYHMREAGCTAAQEIAFTLANAIAYVEAAVAGGLQVDAFAGRLSFFFACHSNFLEEVAKFRAARRMWARIVKERFGGNDRSAMLRFHTQTGGATLTAQQVDNNIVRTAFQAMSAVLGGTQSLHTNSKDEALALPTEGAVQTALRTQQIIAYETGVGDTIDPLAGSYYIESLTNQLEAKAWDYIRRIDEMGGALVAIEQGFMQREIQDAAYSWQRGLESGERAVVGVNRFTIDEPPPTGLLRVDESVRERRVAALGSLRQRRDNEAVGSALAALEATARGSDNVIPFILTAVEAYATLGEISDTLRRVFGEHKEYTVV
jgi:methylmalonyl-CoA mutase N-terminal domain/subunit